MQTLNLGDTLALYINRTDLESLGLTQSERDLATLARRALAERGSYGDGISLEVYPGSSAAGELLLFCRPLAREVVAFTSLAAAIAAAKRLAPVHGSLHSSDPCVRDTHRVEATQHCTVAHAEAADAASAHLHLTDTSVWLLTLRASPRRARLLAAAAAEFGARAEATDAYLAEHAKLLIEHDAVEVLSQL